MLSHTQIWSAIDTLADHNDLSVSALARISALGSQIMTRCPARAITKPMPWPIRPAPIMAMVKGERIF